MGNILNELQQKYPKFAYLEVSFSNVCLAFAQICMKIVHPNIGIFYVLVLRSIFLFFITLVIIKVQGKQFNVKNPKTFRLIIKRAILSALAQTCIYYSINFAPIGIVNSLFYTSPIMSPFVQRIIYKTPIHKIHLILTIFSFLGIILILKPPFLFGQGDGAQTTWFIYGVALAGSVFQSFSFVYLHELKNQLDPNVALLHFYVGQNIFFSCLSTSQKFQINYENIDGLFYAALFGFIVIGFGTLYFMTRATFAKKASYILPFGYITVISAFLGDIFIFGQKFDFLSIIGMVMTSLGLLSKLIAVKQN